MMEYRSIPVKVPSLPLEAQYLYRQGLFLSSEGKKEHALRSLRMAVLIAPRYTDAYNAMGNCLDELGRYEEAVLKYDRVLEIDPGHTEARFKRDLVRDKIASGSYGKNVARAGNYAGAPETYPSKKQFFSCLLFSHETC
jgi:tetratricopeptide (TPR) repeat protein